MIMIDTLYPHILISWIQCKYPLDFQSFLNLLAQGPHSTQNWPQGPPTPSPPPNTFSSFLGESHGWFFKLFFYSWYFLTSNCHIIWYPNSINKLLTTKSTNLHRDSKFPYSHILFALFLNYKTKTIS